MNEEKNDSEAFIEGREACLGGQSDSDNPYPIGSDEAMDWYDGFTSYDEA